MALIRADRVKETSTSTGTGAFTLAGADSTYRTFASVCAVGDTVYYAIANRAANEWEAGLGTYSATNTLDRTTVHASSNANAKVNFSAGTKDCFISVTKAWLDTFITQTSGTTNYVAKTTGTGTIGNSQIFDNGTRVGIGTTSIPSNAKFEIQTGDGEDAIGMSGYKVMKWENSSEIAFGGYAAGNWTVLKFYTSAAERLRIDSSGNIGIGAAPISGSTGYRLQVGSSSDSQTFIAIGNSTSGLGPTNGLLVGNDAANAYLLNRENTRLRIGNNSSDHIVVDATGLVGINQFTPAAQLHTTSSAATTKGLIVRGASGQSTSLQEWQSNNGTIVASVQPDGSIYGSYGSIYNSTSAASGAFIGVSKWIGQDGQYVNIRKLYGTRTIPTTVGGYVEIARMGRYGSAPVTITIHACSAQGLTGQAPKIYMFCTEGYFYGGGVIPPISSNVLSGGYGNFDFELEAVIDPTDANFLTYRIRRTVGTAQANCMFTIEIHNFNSSALLEASNTGTSTSSLSYLRTNNRFIDITTPPPAGGSGAGVNLSVSAGSAVGTGSGGSVVLYSGAGAGGGTTGLFKLRNSYDSSNRRNISMLVRSIPDTVGNYVEVGRINWRAGAVLKATVFASRGAFDGSFSTYNALCKIYEFYPHYSTSGIVAPRTISGSTGGERQPNEFELELAFDAANSSQIIRLRRTKADATNFNNYTAVVVIEQDIWSPHAFEVQELSGTGTSAYGSGYLTNTGNYCSPALIPPPPSGTSGAGTDLALYGQNAIGTGNGGNILLQAGAFVTSGSNGKVIVRGLASNTANLQEWQNNAGTALSAVKSDGSIQPASLADSAATNNSIYYSTTAGKLVYKDSSGTVNNLY